MEGSAWILCNIDIFIDLKIGYEDQLLRTWLYGNDRFLEGAAFPLSLTIMKQKKWGMTRESIQVLKA